VWGEGGRTANEISGHASLHIVIICIVCRLVTNYGYKSRENLSTRQYLKVGILESR